MYATVLDEPVYREIMLIVKKFMTNFHGNISSTRAKKWLEIHTISQSKN